MYKIKNKELQEYIDNNEPIEADCGTTTLISLEDVDIVIARVVKNLTIPDVVLPKVTLCKCEDNFEEDRDTKGHIICSNCKKRVFA